MPRTRRYRRKTIQKKQPVALTKQDKQEIVVIATINADKTKKDGDVLVMIDDELDDYYYLGDDDAMIAEMEKVKSSINDEDFIEDLVDDCFMSDDASEVPVLPLTGSYSPIRSHKLCSTPGPVQDCVSRVFDYMLDEDIPTFGHTKSAHVINSYLRTPQAAPPLNRSMSEGCHVNWNSGAALTLEEAQSATNGFANSDIQTAPTLNRSASEYPFNNWNGTQFEDVNSGLPTLYASKTLPVYSPYDRMTVSQLCTQNLSIDELIKHQLVERFSYDKAGCYYLQNMLKRCDDKTCQDVIERMLNSFVQQNVDLVRMSVDIHANYFMQVIVERGLAVHHWIMLNYFVCNSILTLSRSKCGCRVVQSLILAIKDVDQLDALVESMRAQVAENRQYERIRDLLVNCNAAHVIQRIIEASRVLGTSVDKISFIVDELKKDLAYYSEDAYACLIIQSVIYKYGAVLDIHQLFLNGNHLRLSCTKYGNYVMQCLVQKNEWYSQNDAFVAFRNQLIGEVFVANKILKLSRNRHGSHMIESCLKACNKHQIDAFIEAICAKKAFVLEAMLNHTVGNYVPKTLMAQSNQRQKRTIVDAVDACIVDLSRRIQLKENRIFTLNREFFEECQRLVCYSNNNRRYRGRRQ